MNQINYISSSDDDWTVVAELNTPTGRSATPFDVIDQAHVVRDYNASMNSHDIVFKLKEKNRELTDELFRLKIENGWMAREIKGAGILMSKTVKSLRLDTNEKFMIEKNSNVREDLLCIQKLTKKLLFAIEKGFVQKIQFAAVKSMEKPNHGVVDPKPAPGVEKQVTIMSSFTKEADLAKQYGNVRRGRLPRIEEFVEMQEEVRPRKARRLVKECYTKERKFLISAVLHHGHGISRKKRWNLNRGAPRQAFTTRRNC